MQPNEGAEGAPRLVLVDLETVRRSRGWFIGLGVAFMALGVLAIFLPHVASLLTALVIGWLLVLGGLAQGVHAVQNRHWAGWGWALAGAVVYVIAGVLVVAFPVAGTLTLTLVLAGVFLAQGVLKIVRAAQHRTMSASGWFVFDGILSLALGVLILLGWPSTAVWALGLLVGVDLLFGGLTVLLIGLGAGAKTTASL